MKKILSPLIISFFTLIACNKNSETIVKVDNEKSSFVSEAKQFFIDNVLKKEEMKLSKPYAELSKKSAERVFARMGKIGKMLDWESSKLFDHEGQKVLVVPVIEKNNFYSINYKAQRQLIVSEDITGKKLVNIVEIFVSKEDPQNVLVDEIAAKAINPQLKGILLPQINAIVIVYDDEYKRNNSLHIKNGLLEANNRFLSIKGNNNKAEKDSYTEENEDCQLWGYFLETYDMTTGVVISSELMYTFWAGENCTGNDPTAEYGCPEGSGGSTTPLSDVTVLFTDPCKIAALSVITATGVNNLISQFYNNLILPANSPITVMFSESSTIPTPAQSTNFGANFWSIQLNNGFAYNGNSMSQEAWGLIIAHEILHIYLSNANIDPIMQSNSGHHMVIFANFINTTRDLLMNGFGIAQADATRLALNGISDLWRWGNFDQLSISLYGYNLSQIQSTYTNYTIGGLGTRCN